MFFVDAIVFLLFLVKFSLTSRNMADLNHAVLNMTIVGGRFVWASTSAPNIAIFDLANNMSCVGEPLPTPAVITCLCAVDETCVWGGGQDGTVFVWSKKKDEWILSGKFRHHNNAVTTMRAFSDGVVELMLSGDLAGDLMLWNRRDLAKKPKVFFLLFFFFFCFVSLCVPGSVVSESGCESHCGVWNKGHLFRQSFYKRRSHRLGRICCTEYICFARNSGRSRVCERTFVGVGDTLDLWSAMHLVGQSV